MMQRSPYDQRAYQLDSQGQGQGGGGMARAGDEDQAGGPMTFSQLQRRGYARPAPTPDRQYGYNGRPLPSPTGDPMTMPPGEGGPAAAPPPPAAAAPPASNVRGMPSPTYDPVSMPPSPQQPSAAPPQVAQEGPHMWTATPTPQTPQAGAPLDVGQTLSDRFRNTQPPGQFTDPTQGSPLSSATGQALMDSIKNPSPYLNDSFASQFKDRAAAIDDQYVHAQRNAQTDLARRGLGDIGDSTIGAIEGYINPNTQRRNAMSDLNTSLFTNLGNTFGADRTRAIDQATNTGNTDFSKGATTYGLNSQTAQQALQNLLGFGQQKFNNQVTTSQVNNQQQQQWLELLTKLLGGT